MSTIPDQLEMQIARAVLAEEHCNEQQYIIDKMVVAMSDALWMVESREGTSDENDAIVDAYRAALALARKGGG